MVKNICGQSLPGRLPAEDTLFELIANFLTPEPLMFFNKSSSPGDFGLCGRSARPPQVAYVGELGNSEHLTRSI